MCQLRHPAARPLADQHLAQAGVRVEFGDSRVRAEFARAQDGVPQQVDEQGQDHCPPDQGGTGGLSFPLIGGPAIGSNAATTNAHQTATARYVWSMSGS